MTNINDLDRYYRGAALRIAAERARAGDAPEQAAKYAHKVASDLTTLYGRRLRSRAERVRQLKLSLQAGCSVPPVPPPVGIDLIKEGDSPPESWGR